MTDSSLDSDRIEILDKVRKFAEAKLQLSAFNPGESNVPVSGKVLDSEDFVALVDSSLDGWLTSGRYTEEFERELAKFIGARGSKFVNSGSSANLVALSALTSPKLGPKALRAGDEVVTVAMGFPTTVNPIIQNGFSQILQEVLWHRPMSNRQILRQNKSKKKTFFSLIAHKLITRLSYFKPQIHCSKS